MKLKQLPLRLHHYAWVTRDHEANRKFFEDVIGMPLLATWCERTYNVEAKKDLEYCHTFYGMADGGAIAFFQFADPAMYELFKAQHPKLARFGHIALKATRETQDEVERRLKKAGIEYRITDHGYCRSLYVMTPDELKLEFTVDPANVAEIDAMRRADAHSELKRWLAGDRTPNNHTDRKATSKVAH